MAFSLIIHTYRRRLLLHTVMFSGAIKRDVRFLLLTCTSPLSDVAETGSFLVEATFQSAMCAVGRRLQVSH